MLLNISICYDKIGNMQDALNSLNIAIKYNPIYTKALIKRGDMHCELEDYNDAIKDYYKAQEIDSANINITEKL
jgi:tetratricopeptide (TPR) repeat protein